MVDLRELPLLFFFTLWKALALNKIKPRVAAERLLSRMEGKDIWNKDDVLWKGYIKCLQKTKPYSFPIFYQAPVEKYPALVTTDAIAAELRKYASSAQARHHANSPLNRYLRERDASS